MKKLLLLLLLTPLAFAGWEGTAAFAIVTAATILAVLYMVGYGFDITELKMIAKEELFQLFALMIMVAVFYGSTNLIDGISRNYAFAMDKATIQEKAVQILNQWSSDTKDKLNAVNELDAKASKEASRAGQCSLFGMGYSVSGCGSFSMLNPPLGMAGGIIGFAYSEVNGMLKLIQISLEYSLKILLPVGILLRTFKVTRGAGGFFIALAISLHIMLPLGIIFNEVLATTFDNAGVSGYDGGTGSIGDCDPFNPWDSTPGIPSNYAIAKDAYTSLREGIRGFLKVVLLRSTLGPVIALLIVMASIRGISSVLGAEVDVSMIARFT
ncbi:Uncharacterised protein [Candidatus Bilamarchaeum dharawalense]|uniref:Uncharacterized protein n=1 Tax=Candidatus Bilamarchaeum dharawalense TaxID=2885759 RepID=A0A5E4LXT1_9ARCH|nr:Uncharacterised protein [Candidatus Bilamarchaeum dharawalense]